MHIRNPNKDPGFLNQVPTLEAQALAGPPQEALKGKSSRSELPEISFSRQTTWEGVEFKLSYHNLGFLSRIPLSGFCKRLG